MADSNEPKRMKMMEEEEANISDTDLEESADSGETEEYPFSVKTWKEDLKLIVEGKEIYVSKVILASLSPVFEKMFTSGFKEKDSDELELPGKSYKNFVEFLECFYPGHKKEITAENVNLILPLVHEYQIRTDLLTQCDTVLSKTVRPDKLSYVYETLLLSDLYNLPQTQKTCIEIASEQSLADMMAKKEKYGVSSELHAKILEHGFRRQELDISEYKQIWDASASVVQDRNDFLDILWFKRSECFKTRCKRFQDMLEKRDKTSLKDSVKQKLQSTNDVLPRNCSLRTRAARTLYIFKIISKLNAQDQATPPSNFDMSRFCLPEKEELFRYLPFSWKEEIRNKSANK